MSMTTRVLSCAISAAAACHLKTIQILLPALYASLLSQSQVFIVPPLILVLCYMARHFPPILSIIPLLAFPPTSAASFPLTDLILLTIVSSLTTFHNPLPTLLAFFATYFLPSFPVPPQLLAFLPTPSQLPSLIVALTATHLATRSSTLSTISLPFKRERTAKHRSSGKPARRRLGLPQSLLLAIVFLSSLLITTLITPTLTSLVRKISPRPLPYNYRILEQARGPTGLITVVESRNSHRLLTADLSALGGYHIKQGYHPDSVFSQFYLHEAVRLSRLPNESADTVGGRDGRALCIGVGVGVVAQALHEHSTVVDAVELDPVVARFARTWFGVEPDIIVDDGLRVIAEAQNETYDFVIHDVFTGGGVATELFSVETFEDIKRVMKQDGVLAVNFVGGIKHPPTPATGASALVYKRLQQVFGKVRAFSDGLDGENHNIVLFASTAGEVRFRKAVEKDWLGSMRRKQTFEGFEELEVGDKLAKVDVGDGGDWLFFAGLWDIAAEHRAVMKVAHPVTLWGALLAAERGR